jgi:hypothetical protein
MLNLGRVWGNARCVLVDRLHMELSNSAISENISH